MEWVKADAEDDARAAAKKLRKGLGIDKPGKGNEGKAGNLWTGDPKTAIAAGERLVKLQTLL